MKALPVINCTEKPCGVCCFGMGTLPADWYCCSTRKPGADPLGMGHIEELPPELQAELRGVDILSDNPAQNPATWLRLALEQESPCMWLDMETRRCKHYEFRPGVCREAVKPGDAGCRRDRKKFGIDPNPRYRFKGGRVVRDL